MAPDAAATLVVEVHGSIGIIARGYAENRLDQEAAATLMRTLQHETSLFLADAAVGQEIASLEVDSGEQ